MQLGGHGLLQGFKNAIPLPTHTHTHPVPQSQSAITRHAEEENNCLKALEQLRDQKEAISPGNSWLLATFVL